MLKLVNKMEIGDQELRIQADDSSIYVPLVRRPNEEEGAIFKALFPGFILETGTFAKKKSQRKTLRDVLERQLQPKLLADLPRALDIIGDIAIIEISPQLREHQELIGKAIMESHPKIKTVFSKAGVVTGTYRLRELALIAGEQKTSTMHKEFGCIYMVDVAKAYFSPRLSQEHKRIALLVGKRETIVDLFAGVGPFSILISKTNSCVKVYAVDINPMAIRLLETNVRLNRVENQVFPILGEAAQIVTEKLAGVADRVVMNLPERAIEFMDAACGAIKPAGGIVHFYGFARRPETLEDVQRRLSEGVEKAGRRVVEFLSTKAVRETAPYEWQVALDAKIL